MNFKKIVLKTMYVHKKKFFVNKFARKILIIIIIHH